jgi:hypothetical protein
MSRGVVGCERLKLRATLTDEGGQRRSSDGNRHGTSPLGHRQWTRVSRGRKWGRRCGVLVRARGKRAKRGTALGDAFFWRCGRARKGQAGSGSLPCGGRSRSEEGGAGVQLRVIRHSTGTVARGHTDSSGWLTSRGRGGRTANRGGGGRKRRGCSG